MKKNLELKYDRENSATFSLNGVFISAPYFICKIVVRVGQMKINLPFYFINPIKGGEVIYCSLKHEK